ncbi:hypothetical protein B0A55_08216 [Friedmanniomyces simplex]|uniref:Very-long-chain 3-oxoacyl-CoA reductase n=1 Tax=Friedmanniomyces simplex TaxID=329884 RepID=A0A4U0X430_9PEZI|nr:hypothetical protein B0A55_08216 [Friedmanniomyces simplex]
MADRTELYKRYSILSIPIYYLRRVYEFWQSEAAQLSTAAVGTIVILLTAYKFGLFVWSFIRPSTLQRYCHAETGSWALVTGANDGIGRAFADELLSRGFNVLLHGRNPEKLERVKKELAAKYPRRTLDIAVADASRTDQPEQAVVDKVKKLPGKLVILVNNVGGVNTTPKYQSHAETTPANIDTILYINARFPVHLTAALLPTLRENKPALIINCGSATGSFGLPYLATYSGTKAFTEGFSKSLDAELACEGLEKDIEVKCITINNTRSAGNQGEMPLFTIDALELARGSLAKVGSGNVVEYGHWRHALQAFVMGSLPESWLRAAMVPEMRKRKAEEEEEAKRQ